MYFLKNQNQKNKINLLLNQNPILIISSLIFKKEKNRLFLEQKFKRLNNLITRVPNKILRKVLIQTIFKNLVNICNGSIYFIYNRENLLLKKNSKLFDIICIKFFNKIYFINQLFFVNSLEYFSSLKFFFKRIDKYVKFFYVKTSK